MTMLHMVVVSYENADLTIRAVESLLAQTISASFVVWDNSSTPMQRSILEKWWSEQQPERGMLHLSQDNVLWTPAINKAIELYWRDEPFVGFMNNDIALPSHAVESMTEVAARPEVGIVGPTGSRLGGAQDFASHHGEQDPESYCARLFPKRATYLVGACCILRKEVWDEVGPMDEDMPLGADDHDYCIRLKQKGYQIWVDERVYADHAGHASSASSNWNDWGAKSWARFNEKWADYYATKDEAVKSHWGGVYHEGYER